MTWTDASGRTLGDYPRPSVAVDVALLTVAWEDRRGQLCVLLHQREEEYAEGRWSLPGTFVRERERLADAALRALADKAGVTGESPRQLRVFDDPDRDDRGRVLSVAHVDLVPVERLQVREGCALAPVEGRPWRGGPPPPRRASPSTTTSSSRRQRGGPAGPTGGTRTRHGSSARSSR